MNQQRIVVGFDDSPMSTAALQWAVEHGRRSGAPVLAVHTWLPPSAEEYAGGVEQRHLTVHDARADASTWITAALGESIETVPVQVEVIEGSAGPVLVGLAQDAALLVVGTREHTGLRRLVSGSVSHYCLSHASCPVVAVPGPVTERVHKRVHLETAAPVGPLL